MDAPSGEARSAVLVAARDVLRVAVALLQLAFGLVRHAFGLLLAVADEPGELRARLADHVLNVALRLILVHRHLQSRTMVSAPMQHAACPISLWASSRSPTTRGSSSKTACRSVPAGTPWRARLRRSPRAARRVRE